MGYCKVLLNLFKLSLMWYHSIIKQTLELYYIRRGVIKLMKVRLIKNSSDKFVLLCADGTIAEADTAVLTKFLRNVKYIDEITGSLGRWDSIAPDMFAVDGETFAYINNNFHIIILNFLPFEELFDIKSNNTIYDFISVSEYAQQVGKSIEQVKVHLRNNRIPNARKVGRDWIIHRDSVAFYPTDNRITSGKHIGQHQKYYNKTRTK